MNPYLPPDVQDKGVTSERHKSPSILEMTFIGATSSVLSTFPAAALIGWSYRFVVPFHGPVSGTEAILPSLWAVLFYGMIGGFVVVGVLGMWNGAIVWMCLSKTARHSRWLAAIAGVVVSFLFLLLFASLSR